METIEIKNIYGHVIYTYEAENATTKDAVESAINQKISLRSANLRSADLRSADLTSADLSSADLSLADLRLADLPIHCKWVHSIKGNKIRIGCKLKTIEDWDLFFNSDDVYETARNKSEFKQIQAVYEAYKAYLTFLNK